MCSYVPKQYDSARAFLGGYKNMGNIVDPMDSMRVTSYALYDDMFHNRPETFAVTLRGDSDIEIYLPSVKKIVNSTARFLAVDFDFTLTGGNAAEVDKYLRNLFDREEISKKFIQSKKSLLTRGDQIWHITADMNKTRGTRISIHTMHPSCYFPIEDPDNSDRIIGVHLVDLVQDPREPKKGGDKTKLVARRQTYRREESGQISTETRTFELGGWDDRNLKAEDLKPVSIIMPKKLLPREITQIPVYHVPNDPPDGSTWGMSQVSGIEYIINALNQSITYEDLSLVLQGLGIYVTTAGPPTNADGSKGKYKMNPGNVVEISQGDQFERVTGVASVAPFQDHMTFLDRWALDGSGIPDMATGSVDVSVAQSGIALALKMGPIIAENEDKQLGIAGKWNQIGHDLITMWLPAIEQINSPTTVFKVTFGDPMPVNREAKTNEIIQFKTAGLLLLDECRKEMQKLGYEYSPGLAQKLIDEQKDLATAAAGEMFPDELGASASDLSNLNGQGTLEFTS